MNWSVNKVFSNIEICLNIFHYFDLEEQLQLTRVCKQFRDIIQNFIWKNTIKELQLIAVESDIIVVSNKLSKRESGDATYTDPMFLLGYNDNKIEDITDKVSITFKNDIDLKYFICVNKDNIDKLQVIQKFNSRTQSFDFLWRHEFKKLEEIDLDALNGLNHILPSLNFNCPNLKTLILRNCFNNDTTSILQDLNGTLTFTKLRKFVLYETKTCTLNDQNLKSNIAKKLMQLNEMILNVPMKADLSSDLIEEINSPKSPCEILSLRLINTPNSIPFDAMLEKFFLKNFQHLQTLAITSVYSLVIYRKIFEILIRLCPTLKNLSLQFCVIEDLIAIPSLETLALLNADGVSWHHLKSLLKQKNLRSFTSVFTRFSDNFEYFDIESPLQYLHIETLEYDFREDLKNLMEYNDQRLPRLTTFIWHDFTLWYPDEPVQLRFQLKHNFRNLKSLFIDMEVMDIEDIFGMNHLRNLSIIANDAINIEHLLKMLKHSPLDNFTLYSRNLECLIKDYPDNLSTFRTNLLTIKIPLYIFSSCSHIWLKLLTENPKLQIFCYFYDCNTIDSSFLINLVAHAMFPERIKSFKICGFTIGNYLFELI